jgi:hypothetical protein
MNMSKSQAPRAHAGSRANSKAQQHQTIHRPSIGKPIRRPFGSRGVLMSRMLARVLAALASLGRAFQ